MPLFLCVKLLLCGLTHVCCMYICTYFSGPCGH